MPPRKNQDKGKGKGKGPPPKKTSKKTSKKSAKKKSSTTIEQVDESCNNTLLVCRPSTSTSVAEPLPVLRIGEILERRREEEKITLLKHASEITRYVEKKLDAKANALRGREGQEELLADAIRNAQAKLARAHAEGLSEKAMATKRLFARSQAYTQYKRAIQKIMDGLGNLFTTSLEYHMLTSVLEKNYGHTNLKKQALDFLELDNLSRPLMTIAKNWKFVPAQADNEDQDQDQDLDLSTAPEFHERRDNFDDDQGGAGSAALMT